MENPYQTTLIDAPSSRSVRPKTQGTNHADDFQTPPDALAPLLPYLRKDWAIWEPSAGEGNLANGLLNAGFNVYATDLKTGQDFLTTTPPDCQCILTNPPYTLKDQFIGRCYDLGKPWALLLPFTTFEGQKRQELFRRYGVEVIFLPRRVKFTTPSGKVGGSWFPVAWFTHGLGVRQALTFWEG